MRIAAALMLCLAGCGAEKRSMPEGNVPDAGEGNVGTVQVGTLIVRTQEEWDRGHFDHTAYGEEALPYDVLNEDGAVIRGDVRGGTTLPPGRYLVEVPRAVEHARWFWVTVTPNAITEVDARKLPADAR